MFHRLWTLIRKELQSLLREPQTRAILVLPVLLQVVLFPFAATLEVTNATIAIYNEDNGKHSVELTQRFARAKAFTHVLLLESPQAIQPTIDTQKALLLVRFPADFSRNLDAFQTAPMQLILDGRNSNSAQIAANYLQQVVKDYQQELMAGKPKPNNSELVVRNWYNPNLDYKWFVVPSLIAMITTIGVMIVTSLSVAREREQGTLDQLLVSPLDTLIDAGADALELGIPFSDPLADGPTIQNATLRAFAAGVTPSQCFEMLAAIRQKHPTIPIGLLMYANLVFSRGIDAFYAECARVGVDSVLVADVPVEESAPFRQAAMRHNVAPIFICPPNADDDLLRQIASYGRGYTYLLSRAGVTGAENKAALPLHHLVEKLAEYHAAPPLQGFGISSPDQVTAAIDAKAAGAISGSAIVKIIEKNVDKPEQMLAELHAFVTSMKDATRKA